MPDSPLRHGPALSADSRNDSTRGKAIRAFHEFWSTGDEALLEQAFAEISADYAVPPPATSGLRPSRGRGAAEKEPK
jgi:hypothetical protein